MNNLANILKDIPNIELVNEIKRRLDSNINIKDNTPTPTPTHESNSVLIGRMNNNPVKSEYNLMGKVLGLYENQPKNLLSFEQKEVMGSQVIFTFLEVFKEYAEGLNFNQREQERIQLTFDAKRFNNNLEPIKEKLKAGTIIKIYGRLNNTVNQKTGGRSFSVYSFTGFPAKVIQLKE